MKKNKDPDLLKKDIDRVWQRLAHTLEELSFADAFSVMLTINARFLNGMWRCVKPEGKVEIGSVVRHQYIKMLDEKLL